MALLLQKYDANLSTSQGRARALLDDFVDDVCGRFVASLLYETPNPHLAVLMFNCETLEFEQYPAGWWDHVLQVRRLVCVRQATLLLGLVGTNTCHMGRCRAADIFNTGFSPNLVLGVR
jgi:hypothetical protein